MKAICLTAMIVLLLLCTNVALTQTTETKLNQVELMKQMLGTWKCETAKDTTLITEYIAFGNAMEGIDNTIVKGRIINSLKELWGYDKKNDKEVGVSLDKSSLEITSYAGWFTSNNLFEAVLLQDISIPDKAILKIKVEFKSPDRFINTITQNNQIVSTMIFNRVKK
jgi:hypothetical protein